jgi:hypothetical protein
MEMRRHARRSDRFAARDDFARRLAFAAIANDGVGYSTSRTTQRHRRAASTIRSTQAQTASTDDAETNARQTQTDATASIDTAKTEH